MKNLVLRTYTALAALVATLCCTSLPALAAAPVTGDERGQMMGIVVAVLVVSVILIVVFAVLGTKKGGKGKKKGK